LTDRNKGSRGKGKKRVQGFKGSRVQGVEGKRGKGKKRVQGIEGSRGKEFRALSLSKTADD